MKTRRFKLGAGAGLVTMLLGALMVLAPGAGAEHTAPTPTIYDSNVQCVGAGQGNVVGLGYEDSVEFGAEFVGSSEGVSFTSEVIDGVRHFTWSSTTHTIGAVVVKQGDGAAVFSYEPAGATSGTVYVGTSNDRTGLSHISFCIGDTPSAVTGSITVDKVVTGAAAPAGDPAYGFTVSCTSNGQPVVLAAGDATFTLTKDATAKSIAGLPIGAVCTVTEPGDQDNGATTTTYAVEGGTPGAGPAVATVVAGNPADVVVTNDFPAQARTGALSVDKAVTGNNQPVGTTAFGFTADCTAGEAAVDMNGAETAGNQAVFTLTAGDPVRTFSGLPMGATCTVAETNAQGATSTSVVVDGGAATNGTSVSGVVINAGATRAVVVTNAFNTSGGGQLPPPPIVIPDEEPAPVSTLQVVKAVDAADPGDIPATWAVGFQVDDPDGGIVQELRLSDARTSSAATEIEAGTYTVTELVEDDSELVSVECVDAFDDDVVVGDPDLDGGVVTVAVDEGADVVCTFTNFYAAEQVLPAEETPTPQPTPTPQAQKPQVLGVQTVRALPRTGDETRGLAGAGAVMLALGAAMVLGSKRRFAQD